MAAVGETHLISPIHNKQLYGWKNFPSIPRGGSSKVKKYFFGTGHALGVCTHFRPGDRSCMGSGEWQIFMKIKRRCQYTWLVSQV
jgi:hypothetical protein